jgi:hypothetical protein
MATESSDWETYGLVLDLLGLAALECDAVTLVLETLGSDQSLDTGSLGVRLLALALGLDFTSDNILSDLFGGEGEPRYISHSVFPYLCFFSDSTSVVTLQGILLSHPAEATTE